MEKGQNINGITYANMIKAGAVNLRKYEKEVNDLNVFPIPDGDTGSNMLLTIMGGANATKEEDLSLSNVSRQIADGMLLSARGNSGVILSQFFNGIANGFEGRDDANAEVFYQALKRGVAYAYDAVVQPTEGTMLTVARAPLTNLKSKYDNIENLFIDYIIEAKRVLARTPEMLPVLKKAGVVDSGGAGLIYILEGMCQIICGDISNLDFDLTEIETPTSSVDLNLFTENDVLDYGYCTEVLLRLQTSKVDVKTFDVKTIIDYLTQVGDSVATVKTGSIVKIHVHTKKPYKVLEKLQEFGEYLTVKIENMTLQHNEKVENAINKEERERVPYAIVTTAMGKGIKELFENMGADAVIEGGQTNNPSSEEFIKAFDEVNADVIFVLPNNSNITMVAEQAGKIYDKSQVIVLPSKNLGQGYSAIAMLDYSVGSKEEITEYLINSMSETVTAMISKSTKDTNLNGVNVVKGEYIGFTDKTIYTCNADKVASAIELLKNFDVEEREYIILSFGADSSEKERKRLKEALGETYPNVEIYEVYGEQEVYDFMFILE